MNDENNPRIRYQEITLAQAIVSGIAGEAQCRIDRDGVERCYHPESGSFWETGSARDARG
jgi:hypothetical protein